MSSKRYTVTIYAAAPGTPLFNDKTGLPDIDKETGKQKTSLPGHMFYAISADGGRTQTAYGFAPREGAERAAWYSLDMPGAMQKEEHKKYLNPYYARTMEITEQQYTALQKFGEKPENYGFNQKAYNLATNSCIDFTFKALKESGIYKGRPIDYHKEGVKIGTVTVYEKAALRVLENIPVLEKMPDQMNSPLNRTVRGEMPDRTFFQRLVTENRQQESNPEQPQYARNQHVLPYQHEQADIAKPSLRIEDMPQFAQNIYHQGRQIFTEFCQMKNIPYDEKNLDNVAMCMAAAGYANHMRGVSMINIKDDGQILIGHKAPELRKAAVDMAEAVSTPIEESLAKVQQTARQFEQQELERQMAYERERSRGISIS